MITQPTINLVAHLLNPAFEPGSITRVSREISYAITNHFADQMFDPTEIYQISVGLHGHPTPSVQTGELPMFFTKSGRFVVDIREVLYAQLFDFFEKAPNGTAEIVVAVSVAGSRVRMKRALKNGATVVSGGRADLFALFDERAAKAVTNTGLGEMVATGDSNHRAFTVDKSIPFYIEYAWDVACSVFCDLSKVGANRSRQTISYIYADETDELFSFGQEETDDKYSLVLRLI